MQMYLHYWFADYMKARGINDISEVTQFNYAKNMIKYIDKKGWLTLSEERKTMAISGSQDLEQAKEMMELLSSEENNKLRKQVFDDNVITSEKTAYQMMKDIQDSRNKTTKELDRMAEEIALMIDEFLKELDKFLETAFEKLQLNIDEYKKEVIQEYCQIKKVKPNSSNFDNKVLNDFLQHEGIVKLGLQTGGEGALHTSLRSLILLAEALPAYGESGNKSLSGKNYSTGAKGKGRTSGGAHTLNVISGKCQGLFNNIVGLGGELAVETAENEVLQKMSKRLDEMNQKIAYSVQGIGTLVGTGENIVNSQSSSKKVAKGDVSVKIEGERVLIEYGISVKTGKFNSSTKTSSINLVSGASFLEMLNRYGATGFDRGFLYHIAGAHAGRSSEDEKDNRITVDNSRLNQAWEDIKKSVTMQGFVDSLAGIPKKQVTALFVNINGVTYGLDEIIKQVMVKPEMLSERVYRETENKGGIGSKKLTRNYMTSLNKWIPNKEKKRLNKYKDKNTEKGMERSNTSRMEIIKTISDAKINISLNSIVNKIIK